MPRNDHEAPATFVVLSRKLYFDCCACQWLSCALCLLPLRVISEYQPNGCLRITLAPDVQALKSRPLPIVGAVAGRCLVTHSSRDSPLDALFHHTNGVSFTHKIEHPITSRLTVFCGPCRRCISCSLANAKYVEGEVAGSWQTPAKVTQNKSVSVDVPSQTYSEP